VQRHIARGRLLRLRVVEFEQSGKRGVFRPHRVVVAERRREMAERYEDAHAGILGSELLVAQGEQISRE
jgi:hypothetical protein